MLDSLMARQPRLRRMQLDAARVLYDVGIRANSATLAGAALGILSGLLFAHGENAFGVIALALSGGLDAIDGTIAREFAMPTRFGGVLDLTLDRVVEAVVLLGVVWHRTYLDIAAAVVLATWYVNITVFMASGAALGPAEKLIHYPPGLVERSEALVFFVLLAFSGPAGIYLCYVYAALEAATALQRILYARRYLAELDGAEIRRRS
jgi:archaetidylinositol phosphate synthase